MVLPEQFEPLSVELWLRELGRLSDWCEEASGNVDQHAVMRAFHLAALAPEGLRRFAMSAIPLSELESLLDSGAVEDACRAVIGSHARVDVERLPQSNGWISSFDIAGDGRVRCEASSAVRAQIRAWATFFTTAAS